MTRFLTNVSPGAESGANTLVNSILVAVMTIAVTCFGVGVWAQSQPGESYELTNVTTDAISLTRERAGVTGDGATLVVTNPTTSTVTLTVYDGIPEAGNALGTVDRTWTKFGQISYAGSGSFAVFLSSAGVASVQPWTVSSGDISSWNACPATGTWSIAQTVENISTSASISCE